MALDAIKKSILDESDSKSASIAKEAKQKAESIAKEALERSKTILKSAESDAAREVERLKRESSSGVDIEVNSILLDARGKALDRSVKAVMDKVCTAIEREGMKKILEKSVKQFSEMTGSEDILVRTAKKNAPLLKGLGYEVEYTDIDGFMLYTRDGKVALNATLKSVVEGELDYARRVIGEELFPHSSQRSSTKKKPKGAKRYRSGKKR